MAPVEAITEYLEGREPLSRFIAKVHRDEKLQAFLEEGVGIPPYTNDGNVFLYIINQDISAPATDINVRDVLSKLLKAQGVEHRPDSSSLRHYEVVLDASPNWVALPEFYVKRLVAQFGELSSKREKLAFAKGRIAEDFRYLKRSPKWLQSPVWPFDGDAPLLFVGQIDATGVSHDTAQIYVFFNERDRSIQSLMQVA